MKAEAAVGATGGDSEAVAACDVVEVALIELPCGILVMGEGAATSWGSMANELVRQMLNRTSLTRRERRARTRAGSKGYWDHLGWITSPHLLYIYQLHFLL